MQYRQQTTFRTSSNNPFNSFIAIILLVFFFVVLFLIARGIFIVLSWLSPVLLIATLIIDYKTVTGYLQWIGRTLKNNILFGILAILLSIVGFPLVMAYLLVRAILMRKIRNVQKEAEIREKGQLIEYEEVESHTNPVDENSPASLPGKEENDRKYDDLFEDDKPGS